jgi:enoyl-CoA hydratase/carnithine racemase
MSLVLIERRGPVAIVTLNRPEALNSFTTALRSSLLSALNEGRADDVRCGR